MEKKSTRRNVQSKKLKNLLSKLRAPRAAQRRGGMKATRGRAITPRVGMARRRPIGRSSGGR